MSSFEKIIISHFYWRYYASYCRKRLKLSLITHIFYPFAKLSQRSADNHDILPAPHNQRRHLIVLSIELQRCTQHRVMHRQQWLVVRQDPQQILCKSSFLLEELSCRYYFQVMPRFERFVNNNFSYHDCSSLIENHT